MLSSSDPFGGRCRPVTELLRVASYVHGQVIVARNSWVGVLEFVDAIACIVDAVASLQHVDVAVQRQPQCSALYRDILARAWVVREKSAGVYTRAQCGSQ